MTLRKFFTLTTFLFAAFSFVACSSDDDDDNKNDKNVVADNHEYVDLGLPSGTLWATCNVGASKPEEYGDYFAWGETKTKETYQGENYKWVNGDLFTKYCTNSLYGNVDNLLELLPEDDAATANWGNNWCTPSKDQFDELKNSDYTTIEKTTLNGVDGVKVTSKKNGKTLFFPEAGEYWYEKCLHDDEGTYWTRSVEETGALAAYVVDMYSGGWGVRPRPTGYPVRPVRVKK